MAKVFKNLKVFFSDTKRRNIFTLTLIIAVVVTAFSMVVFYKRLSTGASVRLNAPPSGIQSIPGSRNPTREYASLQNQENINKAEQATKTGTSAIPTIISSQGFGNGMTSSQLQTEGGLSFSTLAQVEDGLDGKTRSLWRDALINSNCSQESVEQAVDFGATAEDLVKICGCDRLRENNFSAEQLRGFGFDISQLLSCDYTLQDLREAGFSTSALKDAGFTAAELRAAGFSAEELKDVGFSAGEIKDAGFSAAELRAVGFSAEELKDAGFSARELKDAGFSAAELKDASFSAGDLKDAGFDAPALRGAGYSLDDLSDAGFTQDELDKLGNMSEELDNQGDDTSTLDDDSPLNDRVTFSGQNNSCSPQRIQRLAQAGVGAAQLKTTLNCSDEDLLAAGINPAVEHAPDMSMSSEDSTAQDSLENNNSASNTDNMPTNDGNRSLDEENQQLFNQLVSSPTPQNTTSSDLQRILEMQRQQMDEQRQQQDIQQRTSAMVNQIGQLTSQWGPTSVQTYVQGNPPDLQGDNGTNVDAAVNSISGIPLIRAGDIIFAVLDTAINSDEPGPILASIVSGQFKGAKLLGSLTTTSNGDRVILSFNMLALADNSSSIPINAFAIDPNTARTALSSHTDRHVLLRYGTLFASSFAEGVGNAFASSGTTVASGGIFGGQTITTAQRSVPENLVVGGGEVGRRLGNNLAPIFNRPPTVEVYAGTGMGILFTQDVSPRGR